MSHFLCEKSGKKTSIRNPFRIFMNESVCIASAFQYGFRVRMTIMPRSSFSDIPGYDPNQLLDTLREMLQLRNDAGLSRALEVEAPVISKIRHRKLPVGPSMLIRMHELSGLSIRELRGLMGDRRDKFRMRAAPAAPETPNLPEPE
jgi:hypothetical protein